MKIILSNQSELPIYAQIKDQIKDQIMTGAIPEGTVLPSIRQLAKELKISVITTARAYSELEEDGFVATRQGKGSIVLPRDNEMVKEQYLRRIEEAFSSAIEFAGIAGLSSEELVEILKNLMEI